MRPSPLCLDQAQADQEHGWTSHLQLPCGPQVTRVPRRRTHTARLKGYNLFQVVVPYLSTLPPCDPTVKREQNCTPTPATHHRVSLIILLQSYFPILIILSQSHLAIISSYDCPGFAGTLNHPGPPSSLPGNWPAHRHCDSNVQLYSGNKTVSVVLTNAVVSCQYSMQLLTHQLRQGASPGRGRQGDSSLLWKNSRNCFYLLGAFVDVETEGYWGTYLDSCWEELWQALGRPWLTPKLSDSLERKQCENY